MQQRAETLPQSDLCSDLKNKRWRALHPCGFDSAQSCSAWGRCIHLLVRVKQVDRPAPSEKLPKALFALLGQLPRVTKVHENWLKSHVQPQRVAAWFYCSTGCCHGETFPIALKFFCFILFRVKMEFIAGLSSISAPADYQECAAMSHTAPFYQTGGSSLHACPPECM